MKRSLLFFVSIILELGIFVGCYSVAEPSHSPMPSETQVVGGLSSLPPASNNPTVTPTPTAIPTPTMTAIPAPSPTVALPSDTPIPAEKGKPSATVNPTTPPAGTAKPTATPIATSAPTPVSTPTPTPTASVIAKMGPDYVAGIVDGLNYCRTRQGNDALSTTPELNVLAEAQAYAMAEAHKTFHSAYGLTESVGSGSIEAMVAGGVGGRAAVHASDLQYDPTLKAYGIGAYQVDERIYYCVIAE